MTGCRVLVVEDHADSANLLRRLLAHFGHRATVAATAAAALKWAALEQFSTLICDVSLPDGDGCSVFQAVRRMYPVTGVALTGHALEDEAARCKAAGFAAHLVKPIDVLTLKKVLEDLCAPAGGFTLEPTTTPV